MLLHGTPLTPQICDGVARHLRRYGPVWCPDISPALRAADMTGHQQPTGADVLLQAFFDLFHSFDVTPG